MECISRLSLVINGIRRSVPCGKCTFCLINKRNDWSFRLNQENKHSTTAFFLTLTYNLFTLPIRKVRDWGIRNTSPFQHDLVKEDIQNFMKRLRIHVNRDRAVPVKIRYYAVGEYGEKNQRPHYHVLLFNMPANLMIDAGHSFIQRIWGLGFVKVGDVNPASIHYVTKYVMKPNQNYGGREPPFSLMSRNPGIGAAYLDTHGAWHQRGKKNYTYVNGYKNRLPRYYRELLFDSLTRELLAARSLSSADEAFAKALEDIESYSRDSYNYYYERIFNCYEILTNKLKNNEAI